MIDRDALIEAMARAMGGSEGFYPEAAAALAALEAAGVRMVPVEATMEMVEEGQVFCSGAYAPEYYDNAKKCWARMMAASPYAPGG